MALCALCMRIFMYDMSMCNLSSTLCQYSFCYFWICLWATINGSMSAILIHKQLTAICFHSQVVTLNKGRQEQILKYKQVTRTMFQSKFHYVLSFQSKTLNWTHLSCWMKELNSSTNRSSLDSLGSAILAEGCKWSKHVQAQNQISKRAWWIGWTLQ